MRAAQLLLTVAVTWFIVDRVGLGVEQLRGLDPSSWVPAPIPFVGATSLLMVAFFLSSALWGRIVHDLGGPKLPVVEAVQLFVIANLGRYVPGKVWQIAGLAVIAGARGVPAVTSTGAAVLGQGIALVAASLIGMAAFVSGPEPYRTGGLIGGAVIAGLVVFTAIPRVFEALAGLWFRIARTEAPKALRSVHALRWLGLYTLTWSIYSLSFWMLSISLDLAGSLVPVASAFAAAYVLGYVMIFAPAGLGPREAFLIAFLTPHFGVAPAGLLAIVARLWTTVVELVLAGFFWSRYVAGSGEGRGEAAR